jgi:hypothetical protein
MPKNQFLRNNDSQPLPDQEEKAEMGLAGTATSGTDSKVKKDESTDLKKKLSNHDLSYSLSAEDDSNEKGLVDVNSPGTESLNSKKKKVTNGDDMVLARPIDLASSERKKKHSKSSRHSKSSHGSHKHREHDDKTKVTIGDYEFVIPKDKFPLLKVMACAIVLLVSIFIDESIFSSKYRYGIILAVVAVLGAIISIVIPTKKAMHLNYFISVVTYAGACLNTIDPGPFTQPGNGYFASW